MRLASHVHRYAEIGAVLARYGWQHALAYLGLERFTRTKKVSPEQTEELLPPAAVRSILTDLGTTYVKVGQILSTRPDLLPEAYIRELEKLQDDAPPLPFQVIREVIEDSIGQPLEDVFDEFDPKCMAAASIGQVHAAVYQGRRVAVKVRRPGVEHTVETDLDIITSLARRLEQTIPAARRYRVAQVVQDLGDFVRRELDYLAEARNTESLRAAIGDNPHVKIPSIEWDVTTRRVLVMEMLEGVRLSDRIALAKSDVDGVLAARRLAETMIRQIFLKGTFHGDPHPGNLTVEDRGVIGFMDFGNVTCLDEQSRQLLLRMLLAMQRGDALTYADALLDLTIGSGEVDRRQFIRSVDVMLRAYRQPIPDTGRIGQVMRAAMDLVVRHGLSLSADMGIVVKACVQFEGVCRRLDPDFEVLDVVNRMIVPSVIEEALSKETLARALASVRELLDVGLTVPRGINQIMSDAAHGDLTMRIQHRGLDEHQAQLGKMANRIAYSLMVGARIIGSSILTAAEVNRADSGLPLMAIVSWAVSAVLAGGLLWGIHASGRLK